MTEDEARCALLVRAFESPLQPPWTEADRDAVSREAARCLGAAAPDEDLIALRARLAMQRLASREPPVAALFAATQAQGWIGVVGVAVAALAGLSLDAITSAQRIDLLAPPLLGVLAWNLLVYLLIAGRALVGGAGPAWLAQALSRGLTRLAALGLPKTARSLPPQARFVSDWAVASAPLQGARTATLLHAAAVAFAAGALASLYLRGLVFEFRAGWQSTFLDAEAVHRLLSVVLAPAAALAGAALPGVDEIARLRWPPGSGENAARWIHLYAITLGLVVVLPRLVLAGASAGRVRRLAQHVVLPLSEPYFQHLLPRDAGPVLEVQVLPYNFHAAADLQPGLAETLGQALGRRVHPDLAATLVDGDDEEIERLPAQPVRVALFAATATPERETHGAFVRALLARTAAGSRVLAVVDESSFRRRFTGAEGETRLAQRRQAWQRLFDECGCGVVFADLSQARPDPPPT